MPGEPWDRSMESYYDAHRLHRPGGASRLLLGSTLGAGATPGGVERPPESQLHASIRELVGRPPAGGVVACGARVSAMSRPSFLATIMSSDAWASPRHPQFGQPRHDGLTGDLLEAHRPAQHLGHDLRHVVEGQVLGPEHGDAVLSAPGPTLGSQQNLPDRALDTVRMLPSLVLK